MKKNKPSRFKLQHDQDDCGVTCLRNVLNYYKADISLEKLREWSGAGILEGDQLHYVVYYPTESNLLLIGDPAKGLIYLYPEELEKIWIGHTLKEDVPLLYVALGLGLLCALLNLPPPYFPKDLVMVPVIAGIGANFFLSLQNSIMQLGKIRIRFSVLLEIITILFLLTVIGWAALDTWNGSLRTGQMIAILQLAGILMQTVILVALTNLQVQEAAVALDRMYEFSVLEPEYDPKPQPLTAAKEGAEPLRFERLSIDKLEFRFPGKRLLLKDISLELRRGEIIALSGESGQGKSTLLQILQKFYSYEGGSIRVNNEEMQTIDTPTWRKMIGVVPQDTVQFSGTLLANICLDPGMENLEQVRQFCHLYGFDRYFDTLPQSYATLLGEGGVALSGGQKQLLALARCLYAGPQLILLDEPTAAMDAATEHFVITILQRLRQQAGMLIISHKDSLTEIADRVYLLEKGASYQVPRSASFSLAN